MGNLRLTLIGGLVGLVGAALLLVEAMRAVPFDHVLSSTSQLLMWIGLGVMAVGGLLLVVGVWTEAPAVERAPRGEDL